MGSLLSTPNKSVQLQSINTNDKPNNPSNTVSKQPETIQQEKPKTTEPKKTDSTPISPIPVKGSDKEDAFGLLLCGAGESGKTTYTRQLRIKYLGGFKEEELIGFVNTIRGNLIETMQLLLVWLEHNHLQVDSSLETAASEIADIDPFETDFTNDVSDLLKSLWEDFHIQEAFKHRDTTAIPDHMDYFYSKIDEIAEDDYVPTVEDVLRARIRTIGIDSVTLDTNGALIRIYDVGGQKNERSKWDRVLNEVAGVIFCVSFADFDKPMFEEKGTLRIFDSLNIFDQITHKQRFEKAPFFLLCNKYDLFSEKVKNTDSFIRVFPEFVGNPHDPNQCSKYLIEKFIEKSLPSSPDRPIIDFKMVALNSNDVVQTTAEICKYISDHYYDD